MIPARYGEWVFVGLMTLFMSLAVSGAMTVWSEYQGSFLQAWAADFVRAYVVVVPSALVAAPLTRWLASLIVAQAPSEIVLDRSKSGDHYVSATCSTKR